MRFEIKPVIGGNVPAAKTAPRKALRVLVVDDNLDQVHTLAYLLKDRGHHVDFAINGIVALDMAQRIRPNVILLDTGLPDTSGITVARNLRGMPGFEQVFIVAITGRIFTRSEAMEAGFDELLKKPLDIATLDSLLATR
jgi:DNA-binding response OmpR family regulator